MLRRADALRLLEVGIHLDRALTAVIKAEPSGTIQPEPYELDEEPDAIIS